MIWHQLPIQPHPMVSYLRVGRLLYWALILFVLESVWYGYELKYAVGGTSWFWIGFWLWSFMFSFIHIYLVIMDGWSRYQNYKRAKDQFFEYGFQPRIANMYMGSKCQRMAAETAAEELGIKDQVVSYYKKIGVKWYHYVPYFMIKDPLFLVRRYFWQRTFMEKNYTPKYNFREPSLYQRTS